MIYYVYILTNQARGTLYIGVTNNLSRRLQEHITGGFKSFTQRYHLYRLVYIEQVEDATLAIAREKQLKQWRRQWKINLIESINPHWENVGRKYGVDPEPRSG